MQNLSDRLRSGALWNYFQGGTRAAIQFAAGIILARLLEPDDFGVFFAVTAYTALLSAQVKFGIPMALLQAKELEEKQWNSAFWVMEGIALLCLILVVSSAGFLGGFYEDSRYTSIILLLSLTFPILPFMAINGTLLRRNMDFKTVSIIQIKSSLASTSISLITAFLGFGPYCFVAGGLTSVFLSAFLMAKAAPWFPRLSFSPMSFRPLFQYSWRIHLNNSLDTLTNRVDNMILGKLLGLAPLGIYMRAFSLSRLPLDNICTPLYQLAFAGFSRIQHDMTHSRLMYQKILCATTSAVFPILLAIIFIAHALINLLYGQKWLPAAEPLQILAIGSFFVVISMMTATLAEAQNLVSRQTPIEIISLLLTILATLVGSHWGLIGVAVGLACKTFIVQVLILLLIQKSHIEVSFLQILSALLPASISTITASLFTFPITIYLERFLLLDRTGFAYLVATGTSITVSYAATWLLLVHLRKKDQALQANYALLKSITVRVTALFNRRNIKTME